VVAVAMDARETAAFQQKYNSITLAMSDEKPSNDLNLSQLSTGNQETVNFTKNVQLTQPVRMQAFEKWNVSGMRRIPGLRNRVQEYEKELNQLES
jgi:hypothetical protein